MEQGIINSLASAFAALREAGEKVESPKVSSGFLDALKGIKAVGEWDAAKESAYRACGYNTRKGSKPEPGTIPVPATVKQYASRIRGCFMAATNTPEARKVVGDCPFGEIAEQSKGLTDWEGKVKEWAREYKYKPSIDEQIEMLQEKKHEAETEIAKAAISADDTLGQLLRMVRHAYNSFDEAGQSRFADAVASYIVGVQHHEHIQEERKVG